MTSFTTASGALFRDRDLFVHDGSHLRRLRLSSNIQMLFAAALGVLLAFSTFLTGAFPDPVGRSDRHFRRFRDFARLASMTDQKSRSSKSASNCSPRCSPAMTSTRRARQIATTSAATQLGQGGPFEPVKAGSDPTFK